MSATGNYTYTGVGDYYDVINNTYKYVTPTGTISLQASTGIVSYTSDNNINNRQYIKEFLKNDPELLNELLLELRREKINKLRK